jgi:hypothetical protein
MWRILRVAAIVWLAVAMLNATAGICLCSGQGPDSPADHPGSRGCCHRRALVVSGTEASCCQIEYVPHTATSPDVVVVAQPVFASTPILNLDTRVDAPSAMAAAYSPSPPLRILRV